MAAVGEGGQACGYAGDSAAAPRRAKARQRRRMVRGASRRCRAMAAGLPPRWNRARTRWRSARGSGAGMGPPAVKLKAMDQGVTYRVPLTTAKPGVVIHGQT